MYHLCSHFLVCYVDLVYSSDTFLSYVSFGIWWSYSCFYCTMPFTSHISAPPLNWISTATTMTIEIPSFQYALPSLMRNCLVGIYSQLPPWLFRKFKIYSTYYVTSQHNIKQPSKSEMCVPRSVKLQIYMLNLAFKQIYLSQLSLSNYENPHKVKLKKLIFQVKNVWKKKVPCLIIQDKKGMMSRAWRMPISNATCKKHQQNDIRSIRHNTPKS